MNRQERELRMHVILTEIKGMEAENLRYGNNPPYREIAFYKKAAEFRALADELVKDKQKPNPPIHSVGDMVRLLDIPEMTWDTKHTFQFVSPMTDFIGKRLKISKIGNDFCKVEGYHYNFDPLWLVKCEPEQTVKVSQWWALDGLIDRLNCPNIPEHIYYVSKIEGNQAYLNGFGWFPIEQIMKGKQYRIEEIK